MQDNQQQPVTQNSNAGLLSRRTTTTRFSTTCLSKTLCFPLCTCAASWCNTCKSSRRYYISRFLNADQACRPSAKPNQFWITRQVITRPWDYPDCK